MILTLKDSQKWINFIDCLPKTQQDVYYTPEYYSLYEKNGDGEANCFIFEEFGNIAIYPFLKNSINQLGYSLNKEYFDIQGAYGYNGVLTNSKHTDFIKKFYQSFDNYCLKNNIITEFIRFHPLLENHKFSNNHMQVIFDRNTVACDLNQEYESIWKNEYSSINRNMIRKAQKDGYKIEIDEAPKRSHIETFIDIYFYSMKMVEASEYYYFNKDFFYNTFSLLKNNTLLFNVLDKFNNVVCSTIFFHYGDFFHYHLSGRSDKATNTVNNFLLDEAVKYALKVGAKEFHFGGGRSSDPDDSLLRFKANFSKTIYPFNIGKKIHNNEVYDEVVQQWKTNYTKSFEKHKNMLLGYREIL